MNAESVAERRGRRISGGIGVAGIGGHRPARLRTAGAVVAVAATLLTSACAAGRAAQTADQVPTQDGVNATVGAMALRGLSIEAPASPAYPAKSDVIVNLVLVNTGTTDDMLTGITTSAASGWGSYATIRTATELQSEALASSSLGTASKQVTVAAGERVSYGTPESTRQLLLTGTTGKLYAGNQITLDFTFAHAGDLKVVVPVQLNDNPGDESVSAPATEGGE